MCDVHEKVQIPSVQGWSGMHEWMRTFGRLGAIVARIRVQRKAACRSHRQDTLGLRNPDEEMHSSSSFVFDMCMCIDWANPAQAARIHSKLVF